MRVFRNNTYLLLNSTQRKSHLPVKYRKMAVSQQSGTAGAAYFTGVNSTEAPLSSGEENDTLTVPGSPVVWT